MAGKARTGARTWTLDWQMGPARVTGPKELDGDKSVRCIELGPILDLLERLLTLPQYSDPEVYNAKDEAEAILTAHGRLESPRGE